MNVGICGYGWVGKAMHTLFPEAQIYDPGLLKFKEGLDSISPASKVQINQCDAVFICVPTPNFNQDPTLGKWTEHADALDTSIVEEVISWCQSPLIIIRSTVNPGDCSKWETKYNKKIVIQPEYLGETVNHPMTDQKTRPFMIIGGSPENRRKVIELYRLVYNANINIRQVTNYEAEVIKLTENRAIAFKVAQCQELYDVCEKAGIDYYTIRDAVYGDDPRFNLWWTFVYPDKRGFRSKCLPKDVYAWCAWAESTGYEPKLTQQLLEVNELYLK